MIYILSFLVGKSKIFNDSRRYLSKLIWASIISLEVLVITFKGLILELLLM